MKALVLCFVLAGVLTFVSYRAMTAPTDAAAVTEPAGNVEASHPFLDGDNGPWL
jgi:hypothetical protein